MRTTLSQLQPFNELRFDAAMCLLSKRNARALTKYEMVKLHVLADVFHTLETGSPILGGTLEPWPNGPVFEEAFERLDEWCTKYDYTGEMPEKFIIKSQGKLRIMTPRFDADAEDFSASELRALQKAWDAFIPTMDEGYHGYQKSQVYFHSDNTFIGRAYNKAKAEGRDIDWNDIIDAYDAIHGTDHADVKLLMQF